MKYTEAHPQVILSYIFVGGLGPAVVSGWCRCGNSPNYDAVLPRATGSGVERVGGRAPDLGQLKRHRRVLLYTASVAGGLESSQSHHAGACWHLHWGNSWLVCTVQLVSMHCPALLFCFQLSYSVSLSHSQTLATCICICLNMSSDYWVSSMQCLKWKSNQNNITFKNNRTKQHKNTSVLTA